jgi:hypothetical protein
MNNFDYTENFDKYKNWMEVPKLEMTMPERPKPMSISKEFIDYGEKLKVWEDARDEHKVAFQVYQLETDRLEELFKNDALEYLGIADHPNADAIYNFAWSNGHSSGLPEVYYWLNEIAELVKVKTSKDCGCYGGFTCSNCE